MSSSAIKGISIEIGGNTEPLNKALESPIKTSIKLQTELKQVERLLKFDPSNTTLLAQKQELLAKTVQTAADKVNALGKAQKQVEESFKLKNISEEQYRAFQREVIKAEEELKNAAEAADKFNKELKQEKQAMQDVGSTLDEMRQDYKKFDGSLEEVEKQLDKNTDATKKLNKENEESKGKIKTMTVAFGNFIAQALQAAISKIVELTQKTREFREDFSKLETNAKMAGVSLEKTNTALRDLYAITGENDSNIEALSNLISSGFTENQMLQAVEALSGAVIKFPDTLKIESLADSLQETLATGKATGQFEEMLGRVGINVESFDKGLQRVTKSGQEQQYVLNTLARTGLANVNEEYVKANKSMIESSKAGYDLNKNLADISKTLEPIATELLQTINKFLSENGTAIQSIGRIIVTVIGAVTALLGVLAKINPAVLILIATLISFAAIAYQIIKIVKEMSDASGNVGKFFSGINVSALKTTVVILSVVAALIALVAVIAVLVGKGGEVERTMASIGRGVGGITGGGIPHNATGTRNFRGGATYMNERGGEIAILPSGTEIIPHDISKARAAGTGDTFNFNVDVSQIDDLVKIKSLVTGAKQASRVRMVTP